MRQNIFLIIKWRHTFTNHRFCHPLLIFSALSHCPSTEVMPFYAGVLHCVSNQVKVSGILRKRYSNSSYTWSRVLLSAIHHWNQKPCRSPKSEILITQTHLNISIPEVWRWTTCFWWGHRKTEALRLHHPAHKVYSEKTKIYHQTPAAY